MFLLFILCVVVVTAGLPYLVGQLARSSDLTVHSSYNWMPPLAAVLFFVSYFIPEVSISNETNTFQQHFVGGGVYATLLFIYFQKLLGWKTQLLSSSAMLFAWISGFGAANELFEFALVKLDVTDITLHDTSWDIVANTSGAFVTYLVFLLVKRISRS